MEVQQQNGRLCSYILAKMSEDFYVEFFASVYDYEVYLSEYIDKFARCMVEWSCILIR